VRPFAVLAERFTVIRRKNDKRVLQRAGGAEASEEATERRIGIGDLAVVRLTGVFRSIWLGRCVRLVRVVQMDPDEEGLMADG
jgi:hypothetical protein